MHYGGYTDLCVMYGICKVKNGVQAYHVHRTCDYYATLSTGRTVRMSMLHG